MNNVHVLTEDQDENEKGEGEEEKEKEREIKDAFKELQVKVWNYERAHAVLETVVKEKGGDPTSLNTLDVTQKREIAKVCILLKHGGLLVDSTDVEDIRNQLELLDELQQNANASKQIAIRMKTEQGILHKLWDGTFDLNKPRLSSEAIAARAGAPVLNNLIEASLSRHAKGLQFWTKAHRDNALGGEAMIASILGSSCLKSSVIVLDARKGHRGEVSHWVFVMALGLALLLSLRFVDHTLGRTTAILTLVLLLCTVLTFVVTALHSSYGCEDGCKWSQTLRDRGFDVVPDLRHAEWIMWFADTVPLLLFGAVLFALCTYYKSQPRLRNGLLLSAAAVWLLRCVAFPMTSVPPPSTGSVTNGYYSAVLDSFRCDPTYPVEGDNDMVFSGHVATVVVSLFWMTKATDAGVRTTTTLPLLLLFLGSYVVSMLAARMHYTTDIVVGCAVAFLVCLAVWNGQSNWDTPQLSETESFLTTLPRRHEERNGAFLYT